MEAVRLELASVCVNLIALSLIFPCFGFAEIDMGGRGYMQTIHITVDAAQETGDLSPVWRPSLMLGPECRALKRFEEEIGYKYTYNIWVITSNLQSTEFSDTTLDPLISRIEEAGGLTILTLWGIPCWLIPL